MAGHPDGGTVGELPDANLGAGRDAEERPGCRPGRFGGGEHLLHVGVQGGEAGAALGNGGVGVAGLAAALGRLQASQFDELRPRVAVIDQCRVAGQAGAAYGEWITV